MTNYVELCRRWIKNGSDQKRSILKLKEWGCEKPDAVYEEALRLGPPPEEVIPEEPDQHSEDCRAAGFALRSLASRRTRQGWSGAPDLYNLEEALEACENLAWQCAVRDETEEHCFWAMTQTLQYLFPQEVLDQIELTALHGMAIDARNERTAECGGSTVTFWDLSERGMEERPEERSGHRFVLGPLPGDRHGLFALKSLHLIQGSSGAGKTTLALNLLRAQRMGTPYFGRPGRGRSYLVIWQDRSEGELERQLEMLGMEKDPPPYKIVTPEQMNMEPAKALMDIWSKIPLAERPDVLLVEGLDMWVEDAKDMKHVSTCATSVRLFAEQARVAIIATVGMPKMKPKERYTAPRDRAFGSSAWARKADTVVDTRWTKKNIYIGDKYGVFSFYPARRRRRGLTWV